MQLGAYTLEDELGRGATGVVWRARYGDATVAIKLLQPDLSEGLQHTLMREVDALAALNHPHIVTLLDFGHVAQTQAESSLVAGQPFVVFEYADRGALDDHLRSRPTLSWAWVRNLLLTTLDALAHAHARNLVHRDLKPANIIGFSDPSVWKLTDFGLAFLRGEGTEDHKVFGTPQYMAPEQFYGRGALFGPHTDLYALGVMAYQLVCGRLPFSGATMLALANDHINTPVPALTPLFPVPEGLEAWIASLLAKDSSQRFELAADAAASLLALPELMRESRISDMVVDPAHDTVAMTLGYMQTELSVGTAPFGESPGSPEPDLGTRPPPAPQPGTWRHQHMVFTHPLLGVSARLFPLRAHPLVGRDAELDALWTHLVQVRRHRSVQCVWVEGGAGLGKSALLQAFGARAAETGAAVVVPWNTSIWHTIWSHARLATTTPEERLEGFRRLLHDLGADELAPYFARGEDTGATPLVTYLRTLASRRPVVFWVDDAERHPEAVDAVERLKRAGDASVLAIAATTKGASDAISLQTVFSKTKLVLEPLSTLAIHEVARSALRLEPTSVDRATRLSHGSPRILFDLLGDWVDAGLDATPHGFRSVRKTLDVSLDWRDRVELSVLPQSRPALAWAALLGESVDWADWTYVCRKLEGPIADDTVASLVRRGLATWTDDGFAFVNNAVREVLMPADAKAAALRAGEVLYALQLEKPRRARWPVIADLFVTAEMWERAIAPLRYAAIAATQGALLIERRRFAGLRVECAKRAGDAKQALLAEIDFRYACVDLADRLDEWTGQDILETARAQGWSDVVASALRFNAKLLSRQHEYPQAISSLREALALLTRLDDSQAQLACIRELADAYAYADELDASMAHYREAMAKYDQIRHEEGMAWCHYGMGYIEQQRGHQEAALHHLETAYDAYLQAGDVGKAAAVENSISDSLFHLQRYEEAWARCIHAIRTFARSGRHISEGWCNAALCSFHLGELERFRAEVAMVAKHGVYRAHTIPLFLAVAALDRDWESWDRYMEDFESLPKYRLVDIRNALEAVCQCLRMVGEDARVERVETGIRAL